MTSSFLRLVCLYKVGIKTFYKSIFYDFGH